MHRSRDDGSERVCAREMEMVMEIETVTPSDERNTGCTTHLVQGHRRGYHLAVMHCVASLRKHDSTGHNTAAIHIQTIVHE